jgi:hypothetical protein
MERLQAAGLVKAITLRSSPPGADRLLSKDWIASCNIDNRLCYRITDQVLLPKKCPFGSESPVGDLRRLCLAEGKLQILGRATFTLVICAALFYLTLLLGATARAVQYRISIDRWKTNRFSFPVPKSHGRYNRPGT